MTDKAARATIVITPRERFGVAVESLTSLAEHTPSGASVIYIDGASPRSVAADLDRIARDYGFTYKRFDHFLSPNEARNIGQRLAETDYVVFIDNDVIVSPGWLDALVACADETGADVVAPLTCQKLPLHTEIHQAGGQVTEDLDVFFKQPHEDRRITDIHLHQGKRVVDTELKREPTQCSEFHCALVRKDAFARFGELDERLLATKEHLDFCLTVWRDGGLVVFEPTAVVTYLFPSKARPIQLRDWPYFALRWSPQWQRSSLDIFQHKWSLSADPYFDSRKATMMDWRTLEGLIKPALRRAPLIGNSPLWHRVGIRIVHPFVRAWAAVLVARHAKRRSAHRSHTQSPVAVIH